MTPTQAGMTGWQVASNSHSCLWGERHWLPRGSYGGLDAPTARNRVSLYPYPGRMPDSRPSYQCWRRTSYRSPSSSTARHAPHKPSECPGRGWLGLASRRSFPWPWCLRRGFLPRLFRQVRGCLIRLLGVFGEPLAFYRCGRPADELSTTESLRSCASSSPPNSHTARGKPWVAPWIACQTSPS